MRIGFIWDPGRRRVLLAAELGHKAYNGRGQEWYVANSLSAPFDLSKDRRMTAGDEAGAPAFDFNPVVSDKSGERARAAGRRDQGERQAAFARSRRPGDDDAGFTDHDGGCMEIGFSRTGGAPLSCSGQGLLRPRQKYEEAGAKHRDDAAGIGRADPV